MRMQLFLKIKREGDEQPSNCFTRSVSTGMLLLLRNLEVVCEQGIKKKPLMLHVVPPDGKLFHDLNLADRL